MSPPTAAPPIARATLTVAALGALLVARSVAGARLDVGPDGWLTAAAREWPMAVLVHPLAYVGAGWLILASVAWLVLRVTRRRASWEQVAAALGAAGWPTAIGAGALLATTLAEGPATPFVALLWASVAMSAGVFARELARLPRVGVRGAAAVLGAALMPLAIAGWWVGRPWLILYGALGSLGIPS